MLFRSWVPWVPEGSLPDTFGRGGEPEFCFTDNPRSARTSSFKGWFGERIALASDATHLAVVAVDRDLNRRLLVIRPATGEMEQDLTDLVVKFSLKDVERLSFSATGTNLAVGSSESFSVLDLPARKALFQGKGRFPASHRQVQIWLL